MRRKYLLVLLFTIAFLNFVGAQTWNGSAGTDWNTASNWTPATVPTSASAVTIGNTANKPKLASDVTITSLDMNTGSGLDFNSFTLTVNGGFNIAGATLNNTNVSSDIIITITNSGSSYFGSSIVNDNITINQNGSGFFYEGYAGGDTFNGNVTINFNGAGVSNVCYNQPSSFNGNLTVARSVAGTTNILTQGFTALTGNFSYTNNAGGATAINSGLKYSPAIGGTVNITVTGSGNPAFEINKISNLTTGGAISIQNSGQTTFDDDTLKVTTLNVNGFTGAGADEIRRCSITGSITFSDAATNTGSVYIGENIITGSFTATSNAGSLWYDSYQGSNIYDGNFRFNRIAGTINLAYNDTTSFNGDFILNSAAGIVFSSGSAFRFGGTSNGIVEQLGAQSIIIPNLFMDKTGTGSITLNDTVTVSNNLNLNSGIIITGTNSNLVIPVGVTYTGGSDASYVDGPMLKTGNDAFVFPVGQNNGYAPISITAPSVVTDQFRAQYINEIPNDAGYDSTQKDPTLNHISKSEYWLLDRTNGTSNVKVTLSWGTPRSGGIDNAANLRVAHWNSSTWKDEGNGATTGDNTQGTIQSLNAITSYSPFTLASATALNPLPVTIVSFTAVKQQQSVSLTWTTENEKNFSHFDIEKANSDNQFVSIGTVKSNNNATQQQYLFSDNAPYKGINLYRLKMVDTDGNLKYSRVVALNFSGVSSVVIYPNPAKDQIQIISSKKISLIKITDVSGKLIKTMTSNSDNRYSINNLQKGLYFIKVIDEENVSIPGKLIVE